MALMETTNARRISVGNSWKVANWKREGDTITILAVPMGSSQQDFFLGLSHV